MARDDDRDDGRRRTSTRDDDRDAPRRSSRDDDRGSRDREETRSSSRDRDDDRGARRTSSRDDDSSRGRDRDDGGSRRSSRDDDDRGSRRGGGSGFSYQRRDDEDMRQRASARRGDKFDKYFNPDIPTYKVRDGENQIRILPPTWSGKHKHYGYDLFMHYGIGADENSYLDLKKHEQGDRDPCEEESQALRRSGDEEGAKRIALKRRVGVYIVDRLDERKGTQFFAMAEGLDQDIAKQSVNKRTGSVLAIDDPEEGYDVFFDKDGQGKKTKYTGVAIDRDPSPLGNNKWLQFAADHPIPEQLIFYSYDHIKEQLDGGGAHHNRSEDRGRDRDDDRGSRGRDNDRDDDRGRGGRDDDRGSRSSRDEGRGGRDRDEPAMTWDDVHGMTKRELEDLIDDKRLDINPRDAKDADDLADWVCEELKLKKAERAESGGRRRMSNDDKEDDAEDKLRRMRESRD